MKTLVAILLAATTGLAAAAGKYPERPVRVVAGSAPGGGTDFVGRVSTRKVSEALGQQFIIDNRGGAAGIVASELVAKSEPDGYTLLVVFSNFSTYPSLGKKLSFDIQKSFTPISNLATTPLVLVVNNNVPAKSVAELVQLAKTKTLNYAAPRVGSMGHLAAESFKMASGAKMEHVAYKGGGPAITALVAGEVDAYFSTPPAALAQMKAGRLRALAVTGAQRAPFAPQLPTIAESGVPGYDVEGWFGLFGPAHIPKRVVSTLYEAFSKAVKQTDVEDLFAREGVTGQGSTPEQLGAQVARDMQKWGKVIQAAHIRVD